MDKAMKIYTVLTLAVMATLTSCGGNVNGGNRTVLQNKGSDTLVNVAQAWAE
jgi:ABC-type phosphate transport system substrate-binding protein